MLYSDYVMHQSLKPFKFRVWMVWLQLFEDLVHFMCVSCSVSNLVVPLYHYRDFPYLWIFPKVEHALKPQIQSNESALKPQIQSNEPGPLAQVKTTRRNRNLPHIQSSFRGTLRWEKPAPKTPLCEGFTMPLTTCEINHHGSCLCGVGRNFSRCDDWISL